MESLLESLSQYRQAARGDDLNDVDKKDLSETDICDLFITPAITAAGWDQMTQIRREVTLTPGPIMVRGNLSTRNKKKKKFADYVLYYQPGVPIAVVEAKDNKHTVGHGMQQALGYAGILEVPSAFSSNGDAFASHNKAPAAAKSAWCQSAGNGRTCHKPHPYARNLVADNPCGPHQRHCRQ